ncbi:hypothetical protein [Aquimarina sediminis]|uniref:hypothetical protein n=1 Tax=Aquimarina sediminis TaxID=2070536 RepID=UPI000CA03D71|nr:hypothetical protein [Aquimarina sediminis]
MKNYLKHKSQQMQNTLTSIITIFFFAFISTQQAFSQERSYQFNSQLTYTDSNRGKVNDRKMHIFVGDGVYAIVGRKQELIIDTKDDLLMETDGTYYRISDNIKVKNEVKSFFKSFKFLEKDIKEELVYCSLEVAKGDKKENVQVIFDTKAPNMMPLLKFLGFDSNGIDKAGVRQVDFKQKELKIERITPVERNLKLADTVAKTDKDFGLRKRMYVKRTRLAYELEHYVDEPFISENYILTTQVNELKQEAITLAKCVVANGVKSNIACMTMKEDFLKKRSDFLIKLKEDNEFVAKEVKAHLKKTIGRFGI